MRKEKDIPWQYRIKFKRRQKVLILPEWDGRRLTDKEFVKLSKRAVQGEITRLLNSYILIGKDCTDEILYETVVVKTKSKVFKCSPLYYRLFSYQDLNAAKKRIKNG